MGILWLMEIMWTMVFCILFIIAVFLPLLSAMVVVLKAYLRHKKEREGNIRKDMIVTLISATALIASSCSVVFFLPVLIIELIMLSTCAYKEKIEYGIGIPVLGAATLIQVGLFALDAMGSNAVYYDQVTIIALVLPFLSVEVSCHIKKNGRDRIWEELLIVVFAVVSAIAVGSVHVVLFVVIWIVEIVAFTIRAYKKKEEYGILLMVVGTAILIQTGAAACILFPIAWNSRPIP